MDNMPTKERILYSALNLFAEKGYDGVGVDLIAENAGLKGPSHYEEGFSIKNKDEKFPQSMDELIENAMEKIKFTMHDDIIKKVRRILAMEQFRSKRMAELTSCYHLENLQRVYADIFAGMMEKGILKQENPEILALEFVSPVSLLIHMYDRQPEREEEVLDKIRKHFEYFTKDR